MAFLQTLHGLWRWLIVILVVVTLLKSLVGWFGAQKYTPLDRNLMKWSAMSLGIQLILGLVVLIGNWLTVYPAASSLRGLSVMHGVTMFIAILVGSIGSARANRASPDKTKFMIQAIALLVSMALIFAGVAMVPKGWAL